MVSKRREGFVDPRKREGGNLLGILCVDEVALPVVLQQHPSRVAWEAQVGGRGEDRRMVNGLFDFERRGGQEGKKSRGRD